MSYEVIARRWRPQLFKEVVGQEHITKTLVSAIKNNRLAHAYLFSGPRGVGKTSVARIFAKALNCESGANGEPCNLCTICKDITDGTSMDVLEIDGASNRGIDEIRDLREKIKYMPGSGIYRIYIIDEVHMLTKEAFNALLKTLEEPPSHIKFFFATTEPHKVPVTILSRCQRFDFKRIPYDCIVEQLRKIADKEDITITENAISIIAREADGSMRDAESLLDQLIAFAGGEITEEHIQEILGLISRDLIFDMVSAIVDNRPDRCIEMIEQVYNYGYDLRNFYQNIMDQFRYMLLSLVASDSLINHLSENEINRLKEIAKMAGEERLRQSLHFLIKNEEFLRYSSHPRLVMEMLLLRLCRMKDILTFEELLEKINELEKRLMLHNPLKEGLDISSKSQPHEGVKDENFSEGLKGLIEFISKKDRVTSGMLSTCSIELKDGNIIEIIKPQNSFLSKYFEDKDKIKSIEKYCSKYFGRDIKVRLVEKKVEKRLRKKDSIKPVGEFPPSVKKLIETFEGSAKKIS